MYENSGHGDFEPTPPMHPFEPPPDRRRPDHTGAKPGGDRPALTAAAWIVIVALTVLSFVLANLVSPPPPGPGQAGEQDEMGIAMLTLQSRLTVGMVELGRQAATSGQPTGGLSAEQAFGDLESTIDGGSPGQRIRLAVLAGDLLGPEAAMERLDTLESLLEARADPAVELPEGQRRSIETLRELYGAESLEAGLEGLSDEQAAALMDDLGWFGHLALAPEGVGRDRARDRVTGGAVRALVLLVGLGITGLLVGLVGFVLLIVLLVLAADGRLRIRIGTGGAAPGVYAETFALWLASFLLLQIVAELIGGLAPSFSMAIIAVGFFASLGVLAWPVFRGVPWAMVRRDVGLYANRPAAAEPLFGLPGYAMALPLMGLGLIGTLALMAIQAVFAASGGPGGADSALAPSGGPAHPIILDVIEGDVLARLQILLVAAVAAPVVEEIMFRGVLYRHLRDVLGSLGPAWLAALGSGLISGFVFAAIHPQGWVAIPALMGLAFGFALVREWRGSIVPSIVVHGISNFVVMMTLFTVIDA